MIQQPGRRSTLPKHEARQRYIELGELVVLEQIEKDSKALDDRYIAIGPFARLDASAVAARDGKTRGAITNLFGSQAVFQAQTMALTLSNVDWIRRSQYPSPADFPDADTWLDAFLTEESDRGPRRGAEPSVNYGFLWALWLSAVPYGLWSEEIGRPSMEEFGESLDRLERAIREALDHFGLGLLDGTSVNDLASAFASLIEGVWLSQCLTTHHPSDPSEPIATMLRRSGRLLWQGATETAS